ncbi:MAG TPA: glycosyltransferase [Polyangiaceae bacterium]|nr:glycosyltransferase [Polyangiaceae bacterium]
MIIVQLEPPHATRGGDWFYRTHAPGVAMARAGGVFVIDATNVHRARARLIAEADVLVLNMVCDADLLPLLADRRAKKRLSVYELNDDVACLQPWNPAAPFYANPENLALWRRTAASCDAIQFCTPELKRVYDHLHQQTAVFRNHLSFLDGRAAARSGGEQPAGSLTIGWGGSHGHRDDIAAVAEPLAAFVERRPDVTLALMSSEPIHRLFERLAPHKKRLVGPGSLEDYYRFLDTIDVGIAPLCDTGFNRCRSDVKFLEYALHGVVPVVQRLAPYVDTVDDGRTGYLFRDAGELMTILARLVDEPGARTSVASAARAYVASERCEEARAADRLAFYRRLSRAPAEGPALFDACAALEGATQTGRHLSLDPTRYERLVHDALVIGQASTRRDDAARLLREASALEPHAYQPVAFAAGVSDDPLAELERALELEPRSIASWLSLGALFSAAKRPDAALKALHAAAEVHPAYELPYRRMARLLEGAGHAADAAEIDRLAAELGARFE